MMMRQSGARHSQTHRFGAVVALLAAAGVATALYLSVERRETAGLPALAAHVLVFTLALAGLVFVAPPRLRLAAGFCAGIALVAGIAAVGPGGSPQVRTAAIYAHVAGGTLALALGAWALAAGGVRRERAAGAVLLGVGGLLTAAYASGEWRRAAWTPPPYDAGACYRFLTATTAAQSGEPAFPSALRIAPGGGCLSGGCHSQVSGRVADAHAASASRPAYRSTFADFVSRRGAEAGKWCQGCHDPGKLRPAPTGVGETGAGCAACHGAASVHALYGSAALTVGPGLGADGGRLAVQARPKTHSQNTLSAFHRSAEFCGSCHRKNWSLPQNAYHWMPGVDAYREWQASRFSGQSLLAPGEPEPARSCVGCHNPHRDAPPRPALELDLFLRTRAASGSETAEPLDGAPRGPGEAFLDVVVRNSGVGHDFPARMPDQYDAWLEVEITGPARRALYRSGGRDSGGQVHHAAHFYRLVALDRAGRPVRHGDLDRMAAVSEWRRIPSGHADLARYRLPNSLPEAGAVRVRLLRQRRPDFARWAGEPLTGVETLAERQASWNSPKVETAPARWRHYGMALAAAKAYPQAVQALQRALQARGEEAETRLVLGRVYLEEGDLLAAREEFSLASRAGGGDRARAWEAAVLRQTGQPATAAALLKPLIARYPRDRGVRFEQGRTAMAELRHVEAAREFEAMLGVDPVDSAAHFNLMLCWQRLNRLTDARREEAVYRLLATEELPALAGPRAAPPALEARPLHVHTLEPAR